MEEPDPSRVVLEDSLTSTVSDGGSVEDFSTLQEDLEADARDFEASTWSLAVDQQYVQNYSKEAINRQDVIYELIQTEVNHVRTLKVMLRVYVREMCHALQMDDAQLGRLRPCLEQLLLLHQHLLDRLKRRCRESLQAGSDRNYYVQRVGDVLLAQFSDDLRNRLRDNYGMFCSCHKEAMNFYKDQLQNNKKFQHSMRKLGQLAIVRRLGVPEGILLITQRITKYPPLVERIIKKTEVGTEEHGDLVSALEHIKETISQVDHQVHLYEQLQELGSRLDPKSQGRTSSGQIFRRDDLLLQPRKLFREGLLSWKTQNRTKDVVVVVLSDLLLLLQKNDQKYSFASLDGKPTVLSLHKLLVREVAHNERAMYLLTSDHAANLYELHAASKEESLSWRQAIWQAVETCPHASDDYDSQPVEQDEVFTEKFLNFQERLHSTDAQIAELLQQRLQLFSEITETLTENTGLPKHLPPCGTTTDAQQGELIDAAITDVENLQALLLGGDGNLSSSADWVDVAASARRSNPSGGYDSPSKAFSKSGSGLQDGLQIKRPNSDSQLWELYYNSVELSADETATCPTARPSRAQLYHTVARLSKNLYSIKILNGKQVSEAELLRAAGAERAGRQRGNAILEQEKLRRLDKQREELTQQRQEQAQWEDRRNLWQVEVKTKEQELLQRQEKCAREEAELSALREQLAHGEAEYQQKLERLRAAARAMEKDKDKLEQQMKKYKKHNTISNPGQIHCENLQDNTGSMILGPKTHVRPSLSQAAASFQDTPPVVPPRRESIAPSSTKKIVPIHLVSTTNQALKTSSVQQQIPTKLAVQKGKEKSGRSKASHSRSTSTAASIEVSDVLPIRAMTKEGGSLAAKSAPKSRVHSKDIWFVMDRVPKQAEAAASSSGSPRTGQRKGKRRVKEDIIFF